jgi:hypothetical protein
MWSARRGSTTTPAGRGGGTRGQTTLTSTSSGRQLRLARGKGERKPPGPKGLDKHRGTPPVWLPHPWRGPLDADGL